MKKRAWKRSCTFLAAAAVLYALSGCADPTTTGNTGTNASAEHSVTGTVRDAVSGDAVAAVSVELGSYGAATSDADGRFTIDLGEAKAVESGKFSLHKSGYLGVHYASVSFDQAADASLPLYATPLDTSAYPTHAVAGKIYEMQTAATATEIASDSTISFTIYNANGGRSTAEATYGSGGYGIATKTFGADCLIVAAVEPEGKTAFTVILKQQNLGAAATTLDLTENPAGTTTATVTASAVSNVGMYYLSSPYGTINGTMSYFMSSTSTEVSVSNPYGYKAFWMHMGRDPGFTGTGYKLLTGISSPETLGTSVTLPALDATLGPTAPTDVTSLAYARGRLSVTAVTDANYYSYALSDPTTGAMIATVCAADATVKIPAWLRTQLSGLTVRVTPTVMDTDMGFDLSGVSSNGGMGQASIHYGMVTDYTADRYKDLTF